MSKSTGIQFELRKRQRNRPDFWTVTYDVHNGKILNIEPGQREEANTLVVSFARIQGILAGKENQNNYVVDYNEKVGVIDLIDLNQISRAKDSQQIWNQWLTQSTQSYIKFPDLKCIIFLDKKLLRIESSRAWSTRMLETPSRIENFSIYITDQEDPHWLLGDIEISTTNLIEKGYCEYQLENFLLLSHIEDIKESTQSIRINLPPIAKSLSLHKEKVYYLFTGVADGQTIMSHSGVGKQITVFVKDSKLWAQSNYQPGSPIDDVIGNMQAGVFVNDDPDNFWGWVEFPALMLRQNKPFEIAKNWPQDLRPNLLYKANSVDIGVLN